MKVQSPDSLSNNKIRYLLFRQRETDLVIFFHDQRQSYLLKDLFLLILETLCSVGMDAFQILLPAMFTAKRSAKGEWSWGATQITIRV